MPVALRPLRWLLVLLLVCWAGAALAQSQPKFPKFTGLVVDDAHVLPPAVQADLTAKLEALQRDTKRQLVVATIDDLQGYTLEDYGYQLLRAWGVGLQDVNNGAILFIAPNEPPGHRGPRIEVGYGLEPILTDALTGQIIREQMMPKLRADKDIPGALTAGTDALIAQLRASPEEAQTRVDAAAAAFDRTHRHHAADSGDSPVGLLSLAGLFVILVLFLRFVIAAGSRSGGTRRYQGGGGDMARSVVLWSIADEIARGLNNNSGSSWNGGSSSGSDWSSGSSSDDSGGGWTDGGFTGGGGGSGGGGGASGDW